MQRAACSLLGVLVTLGLCSAPAGAAVKDSVPYVELVGPVHTSFLIVKVFCPQGMVASLEDGRVTQPHDPDLGDPMGTPAPTNLELVSGQPVSLPCAGKERLVRLALEPGDCGDDPSCVARPGLVGGVRADVVLDIEFGGDLADYPRLDVRVVGPGRA